jgi:SAM-dependent methyltransferase
MNDIVGDEELLKVLDQDPIIATISRDTFADQYVAASEAFHNVLGGRAQHENALFHRLRYVDLVRRDWHGKVLDLGNDKPFLSYFLRRFSPHARFFTVSNAIPRTPHRLWDVDIEIEVLPFESDFFDSVIFTEVLEHLWRNPSFTVWQINRVLRPGGSLLLTTPNPCDRHSLVCVLWQANPNQRSKYYATLESGHLHLWTVSDVKLLLEVHGFTIAECLTVDLYGHTKLDEKVEAFIREISPHWRFMHEAVVVVATKKDQCEQPAYPPEIYPDGCGVQFDGAIRSFARANGFVKS